MKSVFETVMELKYRFEEEYGRRPSVLGMSPDAWTKLAEEVEPMLMPRFWQPPAIQPEGPRFEGMDMKYVHTPGITTVQVKHGVRSMGWQEPVEEK